MFNLLDHFISSATVLKECIVEIDNYVLGGRLLVKAIKNSDIQKKN